MKKDVKNSKFLKKYELKGFKLNFRSREIERLILKKETLVPGALFEISKVMKN